ncbi:MAG TPA: cyclic nucleotide-binding domain-containing protein, partial [Blastococcus sp.]
MTTAPGLDLAAALRGSRLFAELPDDEVAALAATSRSVELAPGEVLMSEGSPPDAMYVVTDGELEISRHSSGADLLLNVCGPGDLIG